jgi:GTP-binding protein
MTIISATYLTSSPEVEKAPKADRPEYAFIGRSNVGKSSLINMLTNIGNLAKTSGTPGKTQLINHFEVISSVKKGKKDKWYIVDLPGYGFAQTSHTNRNRWEQMIENYLKKRENLVTVFILIDTRHSPQKLDLDFINNLGKWQIPFAIIFTKTDKNKPLASQRNINAFLQEMQKTWEQPPPFFASSAVTHQGKEEILDYISELNNEFSL